LFALLTLYGCEDRQIDVTKLKSVEDLGGVRVGVFLGSIQDDFVTANAPSDCIILRFNSGADAYKALETGKCDVLAFSESDLLVQNLLHKNKYIGLFTSGDEGGCGIAFRKGDPDGLKAKFNEFLAEYKADGRFDDCFHRWFYEYEIGDDIENRELPTEGDPIRVGMTMSSEPFQFIGPQGPTGFEPELLIRFSQWLGRPLDIQTTPFTAMIPSLSTGKLDIAAAVFGITEERLKQIDFSDPTFIDSDLYMTLNPEWVAGRKSEIRSLDDLSGKRVGVTLGSVQDTYLTEHGPKDCQIMRFNNSSDIYEAMSTGKCDYSAFTETEFMVKELMSPGQYKMDYVFGDTLEVAIGFRKNDERHLVDEFNRFLKEFKENGGIEECYNRWAKEYKLGDTMPHIELPTSGEPLNVGVYLSVEPFQFLGPNGPDGFEIELLKRYSAWSGRPLVFNQMAFTAIIPSITTGKLDIAASTFAVTAERAEKMDFSEPIYSSQYAVMSQNDGHDEKVSFFDNFVERFRNNLIVEKRYMLLLDGLKSTLIITLLSLLAGTLIGALLCAMRMGKRRAFRSVASVFIEIIRGIPVLVVLMLLFYVVFSKSGISPIVTAVIAFSLYFGAYSAEIFRSALMTVDNGQWEASYALGFHPFKTFMLVILPQASAIARPVFKTRAKTLIRETSVVGYIAICDLTYMSNLIRSRTFDAFFPLLVVTVIYFIIAWIISKTVEAIF